MRRPRNPLSKIAPWAAVAIAAATVASAPIGATSAGAMGRPCFRANDWLGASAGGPRDLYVHVNVRDVWHLALAQDCPGAQFPGPVSISDVVSGISNEICTGVDLQITVKPRGASHATACIVKSIDKLTPDEVKALPPKARPD